MYPLHPFPERHRRCDDVDPIVFGRVSGRAWLVCEKALQLILFIWYGIAVQSLKPERAVLKGSEETVKILA